MKNKNKPLGGVAMFNVNIGLTITKRLDPLSAYGLVRSPNKILDACLLSSQGYLVGHLFGNPRAGACVGCIMSVTNRYFYTTIEKYLPSYRCYQGMGLPLGLKNIALMGSSLLASGTIFKVAKYCYSNVMPFIAGTLAV